MDECTFHMSSHSENYVIIYIQNMTNFSQKIELHITKYNRKGMTKYSKNDKWSRDNPKQGPKTQWGMRHEEQKLSDMILVILSRATSPT